MFDMNFWKEFFAALYPKHYYENIKSPLPLVDINFILIGLYVGLVFGLIAISIKKRYMGRVVRAIIEKEAFSTQDAKTPDELGIGDKKLLMFIVRRLSFSSPIKQTGVERDEEETTKKAKKKQKIDYSGERYYIPEDKRYAAEERYNTKGTSIGMIIFWALFFIPVFLILRYIIPELLLAFDKIITASKK